MPGSRLIALAILARAVVATSHADAVDDLSAKFMAKRQVPGLSILVMDHGKVVKQSVYGLSNIELNVPVTSKTLFQTGSIGKMFTAAGMLKLAQEGKLSLDDTLPKYFPNCPEYWKKITLRHLMTHTSGIPDYEDGPTAIDPKKEYSDEELIKFCETLKPDFEPGTKWAYSNTGFLLQGFIIKKLTGKFYADYLAEAIWKPAGMNTIRTLNDREIIPNRGSGYDLGDKGWLNQDWASQSVNSTADGTLYATTDDFVAWQKALDSYSVLPKALQDEAWASARLNDGSPAGYGYGWAVASRLGFDHVWHNGAWQGFMSEYMRFADGLAVVVLMNRSAVDPGRLVWAIAQEYRPGLAWPKLKAIDDTDASRKAWAQLAVPLLSGKIDAAAFCGRVALLAPRYAEALGPTEKRLGALQKVELLFSRKKDGTSEYAYRLSHEKGPSFLELRIEADGRASDITYAVDAL